MRRTLVFLVLAFTAGGLAPSGAQAQEPPEMQVEFIRFPVVGGQLWLLWRLATGLRVAGAR